MPNSEILIRIVDDNPEHCNALRFMLMSEGWSVKTYSSAVDFLKNDDASLRGCIILDYQMPDISGTELQELMIKKGYTQPILFLTAHADLDMAIHIFRKGANDLLKKPVNPEELIQAIAKAVEKDLCTLSDDNDSHHYQEKFKLLTPRERQVLLLVAKGLMNCQVAARLNLSERTVEAHRASGYRRLGVSSLAELQRFLQHVSA